MMQKMLYTDYQLWLDYKQVAQLKHLSFAASWFHDFYSSENATLHCSYVVMIYYTMFHKKGTIYFRL